MISELRYVIRSLFRRKAFSLVTLLTLALGIGSATAIYSVVDWVLFHPPPSPPGIYMIGSNMKGDGHFIPIIMFPHYEAYRKQETVYSEMAIAGYRQGNVVVDREPLETSFLEVSPNLFGMLGIVPGMGRNFLKGENIEGRNLVVIVTYGFWKNKLGGSPDALGRKITVDQQDCTVVGVLKKGQRMPGYIENSVYRPLVEKFDPARPWEPNLITYMRARPGVTKARIEAALTHATADIPDTFKWLKEWKPAVKTITELQNIYHPDLYWMLVGAVGFLYGIACLNATNLMLVHMLGKQREISVRMALGGGRWRIVRLLVMEALGLSLCGAALGALVANVLIPLFDMASSEKGGAIDWTNWHLGWRTYSVLGGLTLFTGLIIALVPAIHVLRSDIQTGLKNGGGAVGESPRLARLRGSFVVLQATFAVILLVGAGLMVETFKKLESVKLGFDPSHRVKVQLGFPSTFPNKSEDRLAMLNRLKTKLEAVPGVSNVAFGSDSLMASFDYITMDVLSKDGVTPMSIHVVYASPDYKDAGGLVLKGGQWLRNDGKTKEPEILVNEAMAQKRFGKLDVVGQYLKPTGSTGDFKGWLVAGVVGNVRERVREEPTEKIYMPVSWSPKSANVFIVDTTAEPSGAVLTSLKVAVYQFDPRIVTTDVRPMGALRDSQLWSERLTLYVLKVMSGIAIFLTIVGMFSVLAYTVDRRMPEFGIRMALGASPGNLVSLVMKKGVALTVVGIAAGIGGAMALTKYMQSQLYETPAFDPGVIAAVAVLLIISSVGACILPATRASKPDLVKLLKSD
jgi:putative ABC transport system permease protein